MSNKYNSNKLFDTDKSHVDEVNDWQQHWVGMPEYEQENLSPYKTLKINFRNEEDVKKFSELLQQNITDKTKSIWFPEYDREKPSNFLFISDDQ